MIQSHFLHIFIQENDLAESAEHNVSCPKGRKHNHTRAKCLVMPFILSSFMAVKQRVTFVTFPTMSCMTFNITESLNWPHESFKKKKKKLYTGEGAKPGASLTRLPSATQVELNLCINRNTAFLSWCSFYCERILLRLSLTLRRCQERWAAATVWFRHKNWWISFGWRQAWRESR